MQPWPDISIISEEVRQGRLCAVDNVERALKAIKANSKYQAIIALSEKRALERAKAIDDAIKKGQKSGKLAGVPFIAKDNFLAYGPDTTAASNILKGFKAPYQATAIERLEAEGAILVAKANLDAFAHGSSTENSDFFVTKNPHDETRVPGGSSGGPATAVVLNIAPFVIGTDTGGSIRQPASFCGCVGYKPSYGLVSRSGVVAMASSTDTIGPLTKNVEDAALVLDVMAGKDELDSTTIERQDDYTDLNMNIKGKTIAVIKEHMGDGVDKGVKQAVDEAIAKLKAAGAVIKEISLPSIPLALAVYYIICPAEVSSNLARYDGQRFGYSAKDAKNLEQSYKLSRGQGFGKEAKRRIMMGAYVLSTGYYDAYYAKAQTVRTKLIKEFNDAFNKVDFLLGPVTPTPAFKIGENSKNPLKMYLSDVMTAAANIVGNPAISLPAGTINGLPVGLQIMARSAQDKELLSFAKSAEGVIR
jgi:aspartyl-tRNA(Asn)/glutamyl-tRNA(Gln) amidotransferase subunit A